MRFLKLALAVIVAVNGIFLTSAGRAGADPAPCDNCITTPTSGTAAYNGYITLAGYVYIALNGEPGTSTWRNAKGEHWTARGGWEPWPAQEKILWESGEFGMIDDAEVPQIQQGMRDEYALFA